MTLTEFKFLIQLGGLLDSPDRQINISYTGSRIEAIAVRIGDNNLTQLQQATTLILKAPQAGSSLNISLQNTQDPPRTINREQVGNYYLYTVVEQNQQPVMSVTPSPSGSLNAEEYFTGVIILPSEQQVGFLTSEYNVLLNNSMSSRSSDYIQVSDRLFLSGSNTSPTNIANLQQGTAIAAQVQDSNYTATGWINGRYEGSETTKLTFGNIDPAVTGKSFQGSFYSLDISDTIIINQTETDRVYRALLHTSNTDYPDYVIRGINYTMDVPVSTSGSIIGITGNLSAGDPGISPGDLLTVFGSPEIIKVKSITRTPSSINIKYQLEVIRGWNDTQAVEYVGSVNIRVTKPVQIFEVNRSRLLNVSKSKIYIKDNETILFVDDLGQVVSSSLA
jgi:hypothetical protein